MSKKLKIMRNFSKSAGLYDKNAKLQKSLENILLERVGSSLNSADSFLDIGSGTGRFCKRIAKINPKALVCGLDIALGMVKYSLDKSNQSKFLQADGERIPFKDGTFDIVVSNSVYQWMEDIEAAFSEARRILKKGGEFHFIFFGGKTLNELKASFDMAYKFFGMEPLNHTEKFFRIEEIGYALKKAGFRERRLHSNLIEKRYRSIESFLRFLRITGATNSNLPVSFGLGRRKVFLKMKDIYEELFSERGCIKTTFEAFLGKALK